MFVENGGAEPDKEIREAADYKIVPFKGGGTSRIPKPQYELEFTPKVHQVQRFLLLHDFNHQELSGRRKRLSQAWQEALVHHLESREYDISLIADFDAQNAGYDKRAVEHRVNAIAESLRLPIRNKHNTLYVSTLLKKGSAIAVIASITSLLTLFSFEVPLLHPFICILTIIVSPFFYIMGIKLEDNK